ncbi:hypothetical protein GCM10010320_34230 [Streptomyces caelestis]|nr:hypothetical protein GCM10010320_34230 [Streptomyces caelestis]
MHEAPVPVGELVYQARHALYEGDEAENLQHLLHGTSLVLRTPTHIGRGASVRRTEVPVRTRSAAPKVCDAVTLVDDSGQGGVNGPGPA